jgi:hypothetical protein
MSQTIRWKGLEISFFSFRSALLSPISPLRKEIRSPNPTIAFRSMDRQKELMGSNNLHVLQAE